jgi:hypothetical protein
VPLLECVAAPTPTGGGLIIAAVGAFSAALSIRAAKECLAPPAALAKIPPLWPITNSTCHIIQKCQSKNCPA